MENNKCPECGSTFICEWIDDYAFTYGSGKEGVQLSVEIPRMKCHGCTFSWYDHRGEKLIDMRITQFLSTGK